jgi:predicted HAD superfamily Cof-like phosphohydrolase
MSYLQTYDDVARFHEVSGQPILEHPQFPPRDRQTLRWRLINEEFEELREAQKNGDLVGLADAIIDLIYVLNGMALEYGLPMEKLWDEVHTSNMRKMAVAIQHDEGGKIIKPDDWVPPDIEGILGVCQHDWETEWIDPFLGRVPEVPLGPTVPVGTCTKCGAKR